jgi:geranylgeranyl pyrophosphate synthase
VQLQSQCCAAGSAAATLTGAAEDETGWFAAALTGAAGWDASAAVLAGAACLVWACCAHAHAHMPHANKAITAMAEIFRIVIVLSIW